MTTPRCCINLLIYAKLDPFSTHFLSKGFLFSFSCSLTINCIITGNPCCQKTCVLQSFAKCCTKAFRLQRIRKASGVHTASRDIISTPITKRATCKHHTQNFLFLRYCLLFSILNSSSRETDFTEITSEAGGKVPQSTVLYPLGTAAS